MQKVYVNMDFGVILEVADGLNTQTQIDSFLDRLDAIIEFDIDKPAHYKVDSYSVFNVESGDV